MDNYANYAWNYANREVVWGSEAAVHHPPLAFVTSEAFPAASQAQFPTPHLSPVSSLLSVALVAAASSTPVVFLGGPREPWSPREGYN